MKQGPDSPPMQAAKPALAIEQATILEIRKHFNHMHHFVNPCFETYLRPQLGIHLLPQILYFLV